MRKNVIPKTRRKKKKKKEKEKKIILYIMKTMQTKKRKLSKTRKIPLKYKNITATIDADCIRHNIKYLEAKSGT